MAGTAASPAGINLPNTWLTYPYICKHCDVGCSSMHTIREHSKHIHGTCMGLQCADCEETFDCFRVFVYHVAGHRTELWQYCPFCNSKMDSPGHFTVHKSQKYCKYCGEINPDKKDHQPSPYSAEEIKELSITRLKSLNIVTGVISSWQDYPWICSDCNSQYIGQSSLKDHVTVVHKKCFAIKCVDCYEELLSFELFVAHVRLHRPALKKHCVYCDYSIKDEKRYKNHFLTTHKLKYKCKKCSEFFDAEWRLRRHEAYYVNDLKLNGKTDGHRCERCGKTFKTYATYQHHKNNETHTCDACQKVFTHIDNLIQHIGEIHKSIKIIDTCLVCGKCFYVKGRLFDHSHICSGIKVKQKSSDETEGDLEQLTVSKDDKNKSNEFKCKYCGKSFKDRNSKKYHVNRYCKKECFCTKCHEQFPNFIQYCQHMKARHSFQADAAPNNINSGAQDRNFKYYCEKCNKDLAFPSNYKLHIELNHKSLKNEIAQVSLLNNDPDSTSDLLFKCNICTNIFASVDKLKIHLYTEHNENNTEKEQTVNASAKQVPEPSSELDIQQPEPQTVVSVEQLQPQTLLPIEVLIVSVPAMQQPLIGSASAIGIIQPDSVLASHQSQLVGSIEQQIVSADINESIYQKNVPQESVHVFNNMDDFDSPNEEQTVTYQEEQEAVSVPYEARAVTVPLNEEQQQTSTVPYQVQEIVSVPYGQQAASVSYERQQGAIAITCTNNYQFEQRQLFESTPYEQEHQPPCEIQQDTVHTSHEQPTDNNQPNKQQNQVVNSSNEPQQEAINAFNKQEQNALIASLKQQQKILKKLYKRQMQELSIYNEKRMREMRAAYEQKKNHIGYEKQLKALHVSVFKHVQALKALYDQQLEALNMMYGQLQQTVNALGMATSKKSQIPSELNSHKPQTLGRVCGLWLDGSSKKGQQRLKELTVKQLETNVQRSVTQPLTNVCEPQQQEFNTSTQGQAESVSSDEQQLTMNELETQPLDVRMSDAVRGPQQILISAPLQIAVSTSYGQQLQPLNILYLPQQQPLNESHQQQIQGLNAFHDQRRPCITYEQQPINSLDRQQIILGLVQQQQQTASLPYGEELQSLIALYDQQKKLLSVLIEQKRLALNEFNEKQEAASSSYQQKLQSLRLSFEQTQQAVSSLFEQRKQSLSAFYGQRQEATDAYEQQLSISTSHEQQQKALSATYEQEKQTLSASYEQQQLDAKSSYDQRLQAINTLYRQQQSVNQQQLQALSALYEQRERQHAVSLAAEQQELILLEQQKAVLEQQYLTLLPHQQQAVLNQQQPVTDACGKQHQSVVVGQNLPAEHQHVGQSYEQRHLVSNPPVMQKDVNASDQQLQAIDTFYEQQRQAINNFYAKHRQTVNAYLKKQLHTVRAFYDQLQDRKTLSDGQQEQTTNAQELALCAPAQVEAESEQAITKSNEAQSETVTIPNEQQRLTVRALHELQLEAKSLSSQLQQKSDGALLQQRLDAKIASYRQQKESENEFRELNHTSAFQLQTETGIVPLQQQLGTERFDKNVERSLFASFRQQGVSTSFAIDEEVICISSDEDEKPPLSELCQQLSQAIRMSSQHQQRAINKPYQQQQQTICMPSQQQQQAISIPSQQPQISISMPSQQPLQFINTSTEQQPQAISMPSQQQQQALNTLYVQQQQSVNATYHQQPEAMSMPSQQQQQVLCVPSQQQHQAINMSDAQQQQSVNMAFQQQPNVTYMPSQQQQQAISMSTQQQQQAINIPSQQQLQAISIPLQQQALSMPSQEQLQFINTSYGLKPQDISMPSQQQQQAISMLTQQHIQAMSMPYQQQQQAISMPSQQQPQAISISSQQQLQALNTLSGQQLQAISMPFQQQQQAISMPYQQQPQAIIIPSQQQLQVINTAYEQQPQVIGTPYEPQQQAMTSYEQQQQPISTPSQQVLVDVIFILPEGQQSVIP